MVRPRRASLHRARPPLPLLLYAAGRSGRLVWQSADEFAVLEPPASRRRDWVSSPLGASWLARLDRWWNLLVLAVPLSLLMVLSLPVALILQSRLAALTLVATAVGYFVVHYLGGFVVEVVDLTAGVSGPTRRLDRSHGGRVRGYHWTITLSHIADPASAEGLLRASFDRAARLATGFRADPADGTHTVMCFERAITTKAAREAVARSSSVIDADGTGSGIYVVKGDDRFRPPRPEAMQPETGLALLLFSFAMSVAAGGTWIAEQERLACVSGGDCADRPTSWGDAVLWLIGRLSFQDMGLSPATWEAQLYGTLLAPLAIVVLAAIGTYGWRQARYLQKRGDIMYEHISRVSDTQTRVLVLVALEVERDAVIHCVSAAGGRGDVETDAVAEHAVFRLGRLGSFDILVAQSEQGTIGPANMTLTADALIDALRPDYVILTGICFGLWSREHDGGGQEIGDVVVSTQVHNIDHRRVTDEDGATRVLLRGDRVQASIPLLSACRAGTHSWRGPKVHCDRVLSSNTMVHDRSLRRELRNLDDEAIAGEMELAGVYAATARRRSNWIMIKGISDWGLGGMTDESRTRASMAAASFVVHVVTSGGLAARQAEGAAAKTE